MTTIIGIKCQDGIVLVADSQSSFYRGVQIKWLNVPKISILPHPHLVAIAGAGDSNQVKKVIDTVTSGLYQELNNSMENDGQYVLPNREESEDILEKVLIYLHRRYNVEKSRDLGYNETVVLFDPICIYCSRIDYLSDEESRKLIHSYTMYILHTKDTDIEPIIDYATIGSGAAFAEYLLSSLYRPELTVDEACMIAPYIMQEVMKIDPDTGGMISVFVIRNEGEFQALSQEQIVTFTNQVRPSLDVLANHIIPKIIRCEIDAEKFKNL